MNTYGPVTAPSTGPPLSTLSRPCRVLRPQFLRSATTLKTPLPLSPIESSSPSRRSSVRVAHSPRIYRDNWQALYRSETYPWLSLHHHLRNPWEVRIATDCLNVPTRSDHPDKTSDRN